MKENIIKIKSYKFALKVVNLCRGLVDQKEYVLSKQLLTSGTSIGANVEEAVHAQSTSDYIHKLAIAQKEASETLYWIRLLKDSELIEDEHGKELLCECEEVKRIITSILKTTKANRLQTR